MRPFLTQNAYDQCSYQFDRCILFKSVVTDMITKQHSHDGYLPALLILQCICIDNNYVFQDGEKAGVVLLDLMAAYDTGWHRGLHLKLLQLIPDRHIVNFIMEMLRNRRFTLHTSDGQRSRPRRLKNGVPQGSVLAPAIQRLHP